MDSTNVQVTNSETKKCTKCKIDRTLDNYYKSKRYTCGLVSACKFCRREEYKEYNNSHKEERKKGHMKFVQLNPNYYRSYYLMNKEKYHH